MVEGQTFELREVYSGGCEGGGVQEEGEELHWPGLICSILI